MAAGGGRREGRDAEDLKGAPVVFKIKVNEVKEKVERKFDKDLFDDLAIDGVDTKEKLEKHIEDDIKSHKEMDAENKYVEELLDADRSKWFQFSRDFLQLGKEIGHCLGYAFVKVCLIGYIL